MERFKIGTFNLFNLVLPDVNYYGNRRYNQEAYDLKLDWSANQLDRMEADIVGFQEIFHKKALEQVLARTKNCFAYHVAVKGDTGENPVIGLATRFEIIDEPRLYERIPEQAYIQFEGSDLNLTTFRRPILKCKLNLPHWGKLVCFVAHLKSKRPDFLEDEKPDNFMHLARANVRALIRRAAEAAGLRALILEEIARSTMPLILMGDLNDTDTAVTSQVISGTPPFKSWPMDEKVKIWDTLLYNTLELQSRRSLKKAEYTHIYNGYYEVLDHIYVSQEFNRSNPANVGDVEYVHIFNDHLIDNALSHERMPIWQSDHAQMVVTIRLRSI